jgi:hypothetical protein
MPKLAAATTTCARLLTFRADRQELRELGRHHLAFGLFCTWLVGIGRWWDDPNATIFQQLGLGSVSYVFALALFLWLVVWPLRPESWSYSRVLTFVSLTSPPALLYAIPVEKLTDVETAGRLNVWFLATVATWRVALLLFFLRRSAALDWKRLVVATLLPLTAIVTTLTALNLHRVVFNIMGGLRDAANAQALAYEVLVLLTVASVLLFIPTLLAYAVLTWLSWRRRARGHAWEEL